ncbi:DoxX family membrane protein [Gilvibacter sp.]|uniref:DoxX family membrane protein n=1 Tax=Gilvibacter sp. TaxID=2729997 RepID=UPI0025C1ED59|nr:DoxX family membrane protein [Gilvibacter sp.]NQX76708.1 DoxX family membrane protein [Gilvibacter sp.]
MNSTFSKILKWLLGLALLVFGANKFFEFLTPPEFPPRASEFMTSLDATGYVLYIVGALEILVGLMLLLNKWVPFALILLAPISLNIVLFHIFLDLPDIGIALVVAGLNVVLIYKYWKAYTPLFN